MDEPKLQLKQAPIIEAILDVDCDMPPAFDLEALQPRARELFRETYPQFRRLFMQEHTIQAKPDSAPATSVRIATQALQLLHQDEKQLVQVRAQGYSFNRLFPYSSLDDYLPEIERTWRLFVSLAAPIQIRTVRLRYINRILLPGIENMLALGEYLKVGPRLPDERRLTFTGFLNQHTAVETGTGNEVAIILTTQPWEKGMLPLIFDIITTKHGPAEVENWAWLLDSVKALRALKNNVFQNTLTERCLNLFQQP